MVFTSDRQSHAEVHITQVSLAALDDLVRWGRGFAGHATLLVHGEAALLMDEHSVAYGQRRETLLPPTSPTTHTGTALTHTFMLFREQFRLRVCLKGGSEKRTDVQVSKEYAWIYIQI